MRRRSNRTLIKCGSIAAISAFCLTIAVPTQRQWWTTSGGANVGSCASEPHTDQTVEMSLLEWQDLRISAAAATAAEACASTTWPLYEGTLPWGWGGAAGDAKQMSGGYFVETLPTAFARTLVAVVDAGVACKLRAARGDVVRGRQRHRTRVEHSIAEFSISGIIAAMCDGSPRTGYGRLSLDARIVNSDGSGALRSVKRPCDSVDINGTSSTRRSAMWSLLLDATLGDVDDDRFRDTLPGGAPLPCGVSLSPADIRTALTANYKAGHRAPEMGTLHTHARLSSALLLQLPPDAQQPVICLPWPNMSSMSDAAAAGDSTALRRLQAESGATGMSLPGVLTSFNVMISPGGVLQSLSRAFARSIAREALNDPRKQRGCPSLLRAMFEPELAFSTALRDASYEDTLAANAGGTSALDSLRARAPGTVFSVFPNSGAGRQGGGEWKPPSGFLSRTLMFDHLYNNRDDIIISHAACYPGEYSRSENTSLPRLRVYDEVVIVHGITDR